MACYQAASVFLASKGTWLMPITTVCVIVMVIQILNVVWYLFWKYYMWQFVRMDSCLLLFQVKTNERMDTIWHRDRLKSGIIHKLVFVYQPGKADD